MDVVFPAQWRSECEYLGPDHHALGNAARETIEVRYDSDIAGQSVDIDSCRVAPTEVEPIVMKDALKLVACVLTAQYSDDRKIF